MKKGDIDFQYTKNGVAVEWFDNSEVKRVGTCLEESKEKYQQLRVKEQTAKIPVPYPEIIKYYNSGMDGVDLLDQKTAAYK